jgi:hypothetical protein
VGVPQGGPGGGSGSEVVGVRPGFVPPPTPGPQAPARERRPVALRPARVGGDREWTLFVECKADEVVLYPSRRRFPLADLAQPQGRANLLQAVQQQIERRQALITPGEPPVRPQVRFLIWPEGLRAFYQAYPALDPLPLPKTRQALDPEDDVAAIVAGN